MVIVYNSNTGTTEKYALALAEKLGVEAVSFKKAGEIDDEVLFMSWVMMGDIRGLADARSKYNLKGIAAVCVMDNGEAGKEKLARKNNITEQFFSLPGIFNIKKLSGMYKMMMSMALNMMKAKNNSPEDAKALEAFKNGIDLYDESSLDQIISALQ